MLDKLSRTKKIGGSRYVYEISDQQVLQCPGKHGKGRTAEHAGGPERPGTVQRRAERGKAGAEGPQRHDAGQPSRFPGRRQGDSRYGVQAPREPGGDREGLGAHRELPDCSGGGPSGEGSLPGSCEGGVRGRARAGYGHVPG